NGAIRPANGTPPAAVETVTVALYADETGGAPIWQETQNVIVDASGHYTALLGAMTPAGLPADLFAAADQRWLQIHVERAGDTDQPRVPLASVAYSLRAMDSDMLGGHPASAYQLATRPGDPASPEAARSGTGPL